MDTQEHLNRIEQETTSHSSVNEDEINLLDYLLVVIKGWRTVAFSCFVGGILAAVALLVLPKTYESSARVIPPSDSAGGLTSLVASSGLSDLASLAGIPSGGGSGALFVGFLRSRTVSDAIIDKFDLMHVYDQEYRVKTYEDLSDHVSIELDSESGILSIKIGDEDPQRAANIANAYVAELQSLNQKLNLETAGRERLFLEERLQVVKRDLIAAEEAITQFRKKNRTFNLDAQSTAVIEALATMKADLAAKEVRLGVLSTIQTAESPEYKLVKEGITQLKEQIRELELEESPTGKKYAPGDIFIAPATVPQLNLEFGRLMRDFKIQEGLFELLTKQYELAKLSEAKNSPPLQVLDIAVPADNQSKPKASIVFIGMFFVLSFFSIIYLFFLEYFKNASSKDQARFAEIRQSLRFRNRNK